jgi:alpha-glucuronidase
MQLNSLEPVPHPSGGTADICLLSTDVDESAYVLQLRQTKAGPMLLIVSGGAPGMLYGAFAVLRHVRLGLPFTSAAVDTVQVPSTRVRLLNHWSNWRGKLLVHHFRPVDAIESQHLFT